MKTISRYLMTLVALFALTAGAWADEATITLKCGTTEKTYENVTLPWSTTADILKAVVTDINFNININAISGGDGKVVKYGNENFTVTGTFSGEATVTVTYNMGSSATITVTAPGPLMTLSDDGKTATMESMPASDVTVDYEIVRDLADRTAANITVGEGQEAETLEADSRLRIQKNGDKGYVFVNPLAISFSDELENVTIAKDGFETAKLKPQFYLQQDDAQNPWALVTDINTTTGLPNILQPGQVYCVTFVSDEGSIYDGETPQSVTITLFEGYELTIPAKEYVTYYRTDDNLYVEGEGAKLYTITAVEGSKATATEITSANKEMPFLVYNSNEETKTFLLIPTDAVINQEVYAGFIGTAEASTIPASDESSTNYAFNGKQFVWVKNAIDIAANKCWLAIYSGEPSAHAIDIVFGDATGVNAIHNSQFTIEDGVFYDLNGRKLQGIPTKKGVYILNGKKVVVK